MDKRPLPSITDAELRVLEELWRRGDATIRDLRDALYPQGGALLGGAERGWDGSAY